MKNKAGLFVLLAEILAIIVLHTARLTRSANDKPMSQTENNAPEQKQVSTVAYNLK